MSLRYQLSIRILLISLCILLLAGTLATWQAKKSVSEEVDSSINLALQLIKIGLGSTKSNETDWIYRLNSLKQTRHLKIQLKKTSGEIVKITQDQPPAEKKDSPPLWFINLVLSDYPEAEYKILSLNNDLVSLIIQAKPLDEITEVWHETVTFFSLILLLILLTFISVHLVFNKTLQAINTIVENLKEVEKGEYQKKLADFSTQEYAEIANAINHMTDVLDNTQKQNKALTQHSLKIQEEERQRLSQELHDEFGQSLTAIKVMAVTASHKDSDTKKITTSITEICDHLMIVVRSMMKQLHPLILTELGLKATLEDLINHWNEKNQSLSFSLLCENEVDTLDGSITIQVFRVIQECLTNIIRHANASQVTIKLTIDSHTNTLHLLVSDNGQGCQLDDISSGFGLLGIKERIKILEGKFSLQSKPNHGMQINAQIPVSHKPNKAYEQKSKTIIN
ncbi:MAG: histidine kinase [Methylococcales bacterium]|nr:histidine kinase [Methylococcales bacterium]